MSFGQNTLPLNEQLEAAEDISRRWRTEGPQLIKEADEENNSVKLMTIITQGIVTNETWPSYRDGGVVDLLVKLVCESPDHGPNVPMYIIPPWNLPMQGLSSISNRTLLLQEEHTNHFEEWDGPTNSKLKGEIGRILRRVLRDERLKYLNPRHDVASFLSPFLKVGDAQWIQSIPEVWQFLWTSWALDSLGDRQEQRDLFSDQLHYTLNMLYPTGKTDTRPEKPLITTDEALKRALSLLKPLPQETASNTMSHIDCMWTICRLYPDFSRMFLEGGVLAQSVKAIGARAFASINPGPQPSRESSNSKEWDNQILDHANTIIQFWTELLRSGDVKGTEKDGKAIVAVLEALDTELMDRIAFVVTRARDEEDLKSVKILLSLLFDDYAQADIVLAHQMILKQVFIMPRMHGFSKDDSAPVMTKSVGSAWMHHVADFESIIWGVWKTYAWIGCKFAETSPV